MRLRPATRRLLLALSPLLLAATPARPQATGALRVTAGGLARAYDANGVGADLRFRGRELKLVGVVAAVTRDDERRVVVRFDTDQGSVACHFPESQAQAVGQLRKGTLVAVSGQGGDPVQGLPRVTNGALAWVDGELDTPPPAVLAASVDLCLSKGLFAGADTMHSVDDDATADPAKPSKPVPARLRLAGRRATARLAKRHEAALPCLHPLVSAVVWCDRTGARSPECGARLVRDSRRLLARD